MFVSQKTLTNSIREAFPALKERTALEEEILDLQQEIKSLEHTKKLEEEDIKHMVKMQKERQAQEYKFKEKELELDFQRRELESKADKSQKIAAVREKFYNDLRSAEKQMKETVEEVLKAQRAGAASAPPRPGIHRPARHGLQSFPR